MYVYFDIKKEGDGERERERERERESLDGSVATLPRCRTSASRPLRAIINSGNTHTNKQKKKANDSSAC